MTNKRKKIYIILLILLIVLVALRIALPFIAKNYINKQLNNIEGYHASIDDVDLSLYRGAFGIGDLLIYEEASATPDSPFVRLPRMDFNIDWRALLRGKIVSQIHLDGLEVYFTKYQEETVIEDDPRINFAEGLQKMNPIEINKLEVTNATIVYRDPTSSPKVNVYFDEFTLHANNLTNVQNPDIALPANIKINSKAMGKGRMALYADLNILKQIPNFDINISFEEIDLVKFNNFIEAYANLNLESGVFNVYAESIAKDGAITGYVKPIIEDFSVNTEQEDRSLFEKVYEGGVDIAANILENRKEDRIASRVEIDGNIEKVETNIWQTIFSLLRNAFIEAYSKEIENAINFGTKEPKK